MSLTIPSAAIARYALHLDGVQTAMPIDGALDTDAVSGLRFVFLCYSNRCGSNLVAETIASDGQLNLAAECWNAEEVARVAKLGLVVTFQEYFAGIARHNARGGVFVSKLNIEHLTLLYCTGLLDAVAASAQFIYVERSDKLAQAISWAIAAGTSWWASYTVPKRSVSELVFSRFEIERHLELVLDHDMLFERFFAHNGLSPLRLVYEQFVAAPDRATAEVGAMLGLPDLRVVPADIQIARQTSETNARWHAQYLATAAQ